MIFVTVGSQKFQFDRLIRAVDSYIGNNANSVTAFAQTGYSNYKPKHMEFAPFLDRADFTKRINESELIVTHGGTGVIVNSLKAGKAVVAMPRLKRFGEHIDDHQIQIVEQFSMSGLIVACMDETKIASACNNAINSSTRKFESNSMQFMEDLSRYIASLEVG